MTIIEQARKLRSAIVKASISLDDVTASVAPELFSRVKYDNSLITAGTRINWNGVVKKAAVDLWDTESNNPDNAPAIWADLDYKNGYRIIPETITTTLAFAKDECGWWNDELYRSVVDANVYTPVQYPANWNKVND